MATLALISDVPLGAVDEYSLGGFQRLSGYQNGQLSGNDLVFLRLGVFTGDESEIDIANPGGGHEPEFVEWRWEPIANLPGQIFPNPSKTALNTRLAGSW